MSDEPLSPKEVREHLLAEAQQCPCCGVLLGFSLNLDAVSEMELRRQIARLWRLRDMVLTPVEDQIAMVVEEDLYLDPKSLREIRDFLAARKR